MSNVVFQNIPNRKDVANGSSQNKEMENRLIELIKEKEEKWKIVINNKQKSSKFMKNSDTENS